MRMFEKRFRGLLIISLSLSLVSCFGGHGGGGGGGNGGGGGGGGNSTPSPVFAISVVHTGNFQQGQGNVTYTVTVSNGGTAATSGTSSVTITLPAGETLVSLSGSGWAFPGGGVATRTDSLGFSQVWPVINVTVNVAINAVNPQVLSASVSGGGASNTATAQDSTTIVAASSLLLGRYAFLFSGFDASGAVTIAASINVDSNGNVTGEEDFKDPTTVVSIPNIGGHCANAGVEVGTCQLPAGNKMALFDWNLRTNLIAARVAEDPSDAPSGCGPGTNGNCGSGILISQQVPTGNPFPSLPQVLNGVLNFGLVGTDSKGRIAAEGVIFLDGNGNITPQPGTLSQGDVNDNGTLIQPTPLTAWNVKGNFTPFPGPPAPTIDANGRATMTMTICTIVSQGACTGTQQVLTLAVYVIAPVGSTTNNNPGRAFAIDITPTLTSTQVLSGQFFPQTPNLSASSISGPNVFWTWGIAPGTPPTSSTTVGAFNTSPASLTFDLVSAGKVNGGGGINSPLNGTNVVISYTNSNPNNGRVVLTATVSGAPFSEILYLDAPNDGFLMGTDNTVSFGDFTGQVPVANLNNNSVSSSVKGAYASGTVSPVLPSVPNGISPVALIPTGQTGSGATLTFNGNFVAGQTKGTYLFVQATGRGTAHANQGLIFQTGGDAVLYFISPNNIILMGANNGDVSDAIGIIQY
jgi:uncharacterized repeat protein (TIGR01451 family)